MEKQLAHTLHYNFACVELLLIMKHNTYNIRKSRAKYKHCTNNTRGDVRTPHSGSIEVKLAITLFRCKRIFDVEKHHVSTTAHTCVHRHVMHTNNKHSNKRKIFKRAWNRWDPRTECEMDCKLMN